MKKIKIIITDDHSIVRSGLKRILLDYPDISDIDEAEDGQDLLEKARKNKYDVILLDITMPGRSGLEILKQLKIENPEMPVIILSMHTEDEYAIRSLKAGASGYLTKDTDYDILYEAIKKVSNGGKYISHSLAENLADNLHHDFEKPPHEYLSDREYQVLCMLTSGKTISEIAKEMFVNAKTVSTYKSRILDKMNLKNTSELIRYGIENSLVE